SPKNSQHTRAPTRLMDKPQANLLLKSDLRSSEGAALAMHKAPAVDNGDVSTIIAPTLMETAIAIGSPPPNLAIRAGIVGMNAGMTTPAELA
ncbi:MAG: hypothetical protein DMG17_27795, partial [Acidobacteria bacterium]